MASPSNSAKQGLPPFKCPELPTIELQSLVSKCESIALDNKFLVSYEPKPQIITENNMKYTVCLAENLAKKPNNTGNKDKQQKKPNKPFDPFAGPFTTGAHVCDLGEDNKYRLILNKFPVLPNHTLIISSDWVQQTTPLNKTDFDITWKVFQSLLLNKQNPLIFINSGVLSGATQMHRHLHCIPSSTETLLLNEIAKTFQDEEKISDNQVKVFAGYSFLHGIVLLDSKVESDQLCQNYNVLLKWIQNEMRKANDIDNEYLSDNKFSYNLLITEHVMMMVARKCGVFEGVLKGDSDIKGKNNTQRIPINALPFAGLIFFNSDRDRKLFYQVGITKMLLHCTFPTNPMNQ